MTPIKEIAKQKERENGNEKISQKEMIWYLIHQIDNLKGNIETKVDKKTFRWAISGGLVLLGILLALV